MVGHRSHVVVLRVAGRNRLRIEILRVNEIGVLGTQMERGGHDLFRRDDPVGLSKRIDPLLLGFVAGERKRPAGILLEVL